MHRLTLVLAVAILAVAFPAPAAQAQCVHNGRLFKAPDNDACWLAAPASFPVRNTPAHPVIDPDGLGSPLNQTTYELIAKGVCKCKDGSCIVLECTREVGASVEVTKGELSAELKLRAREKNGEIEGEITFTLRSK